jgi:hypothetical protein
MPKTPEAQLAHLALQAATAAVLEAIYAPADDIELAVSHARAQIERARQFATAAAHMIEEARRMRKSLRARMAGSWGLPPDDEQA